MKKRKWNKIPVSILIVFMFSILLATGCGNGEKNRPNAENPVTITIWHYYNGVQQLAFDRLVKEFNESAGLEQGIYVEGHSKGDVSALEEAVLASMRRDVGSEEAPDAFSCYADTAYAVEQMGMLADISRFMSEEELASYVPSYIEEGRIGSGRELMIFPIAKSSEVMMLNKTQWDEFSQATGVQLDTLATNEGLAETAEQYYEWTDAQTPDISGDGGAFYGRDAMANLFIIGSMQLGNEIFQVKDGRATLNLNKEVMKKIWDTWYVPYIKGYFSSYGRFRSDDVKTGEILGYTGSTASAMYFPDAVETDTEYWPIEYLVIPAPKFEGGEDYAIQQGAGMVVSTSTEEREFACVVFFKWLTEVENNMVFGCTSGYMPVKSEANNTLVLDEVIAEKELEVPPKIYDTLAEAFLTVNNSTMYTNKAFEGGTAARKVLEYNLSDKAAADRQEIKLLLEQGLTLEEATAPYLTKEAFENWYASFLDALKTAIESK